MKRAVLLLLCSGCFDLGSLGFLAPRDASEGDADRTSDDGGPLPDFTVPSDGFVDGDMLSTPGKALMFDPAHGQRVSLPTSNDYYPTTGFTWEVWFNASALPTTTGTGKVRMLVTMADTTSCENIHLGFSTDSTPQRSLGFQVDGVACTQQDTNPLSYYSSVAPFVTGRWYHLAAVRDYANNRVLMYLDGALVASQSSTFSPIARSMQASIGRFSDGASQNYGFWSGALDELRMYSAPLSASTILAHYNSGKGTYGAANEANLVAGFHFDETSGTTAADYSGHGKNGTYASSDGTLPTPTIGIVALP